MLKTVSYFYKTLHIWCLLGLWICLCLSWMLSWGFPKRDENYSILIPLIDLIFASKLLAVHNNAVVTATSKTWTRTLDLDPGPGPGPWTRTRTRTLDPDPEKPGPWKTWTLKNIDPEKPGINIGLKNMSDFRELCFPKTIRNVSYCLKFVYEQISDI